MEKGFITTMTVPVTMDNGIRMFNKVLELRNGQMDLHIKGMYVLIKPTS